MTELSIGEVAERAGVRPSAIRYYEEAGLLPEPERVEGERRYDPGVLRRLALVQVSRRAGLTIAEIRTLLHGFPEDAPPPVRWRELAGSKLEEVDELIARAQEMRGLLEQALRCDCESLDECVPRNGDRYTRA